MSKCKEVSPTLASQGIIDFNLHYGPFAHHWWHEISTENGSEFYPICLGMTILTELNTPSLMVINLKSRNNKMITPLDERKRVGERPIKEQNIKK
ncbi:1880_t:CDS:2 [Entrophospora sp. SA101]|nr:1880_t:CDS:2 [Entrophospora sp. SA101]